MLTPEKGIFTNSGNHQGWAAGWLLDAFLRTPAGEQRSFIGYETKRGTELVIMNSHRSIVVPPGEKGQVATFDMCGCTAVASALTLSDGTRKAHIQHYSPPNREEGIGRLTKYLASARHQKGIVDARTVIMTPRNPNPGLHLLEEQSDLEDQRYELLNSLNRIAQQLPGVPNSVHAYFYNTSPTFDTYGAGTLMVELAASGKTTILADLIPVQPFSTDNLMPAQ